MRTLPKHGTLLLLAWIMGCGANHGCRTHPATPSPDGTLTFHGMCDASGAVPLGSRLFAVADDEDNVLRVYDARRAGSPTYAVDVSPALDLPRRKRTPEADIEAATKLGQYALWLTSHGRSSSGKLKQSRFRFFATTAPEQGTGLALVGHPYEALLTDMQRAPQLRAFGLEAAAGLPPKSDGGLNIEGMTRRGDDHSVLIGFRNPRPGGKALLVPLLNPLRVIEGAHAEFGQAQLLDLGGLSIRALSFWRGRYLISAGSWNNQAHPRLFIWDGQNTPTPLSLNLRGLNPEALVSFEDEPRILLLSDDGSRKVDGRACKDLHDPTLKSFRGLWVDISGS
jgi:hypothetical protein